MTRTPFVCRYGQQLPGGGSPFLCDLVDHERQHGHADKMPLELFRQHTPPDLP